MALHSLPCLPEPSWKGGGRPFPPRLRPLLLWAWGGSWEGLLQVAPCTALAGCFPFAA